MLESPEEFYIIDINWRLNYIIRIYVHGYGKNGQSTKFLYEFRL